MKASLSNIILVVLNVAGLCMAVSEGSPYFWANFVGLSLFGATSYLLGLFRDPYKHR